MTGGGRAPMFGQTGGGMHSADTCVYIDRVDPVVEAVPTKTRPKKLRLTTSDGKKHVVLLKVKPSMFFKYAHYRLAKIFGSTSACNNC
jgi:hypothetical protein